LITKRLKLMTEYYIAGIKKDVRDVANLLLCLS
jgi:hypothetical protein